jgi:hypothetical protein
VQDLEILVEDLHRIHARNRGRARRNTHRIRKCFGGSERPVDNGLSGTTHALHGKDRHALLHGAGRTQMMAAQARSPSLDSEKFAFMKQGHNALIADGPEPGANRWATFGNVYAAARTKRCNASSRFAIAGTIGEEVLMEGQV